MTTRGWKCHTRAPPTNDCVICLVVWIIDGGVGVFPTRWRPFWEFYPQDGGVGVLPTRWQRLWVLPTRWRRGRIAYKMAAMLNQQNVNKNNVEYVLRLHCRIYLVNVTWPSDSSMSDHGVKKTGGRTPRFACSIRGMAPPSLSGLRRCKQWPTACMISFS